MARPLLLFHHAHLYANPVSEHVWGRSAWSDRRLPVSNHDSKNTLLKTRNFVFKTRHFVSKMMNFADFVSKMMNFAGSTVAQDAAPS